MALPYTDGNIVATSFTATINNVTYVFNNATLDYPSSSVEVTDANGTPTAAYHWQSGNATGTAEIQVNAAADKGDLRGETFSTNTFLNTAQNFVVTSQSAPVSKGDPRVYNIGYALKLS
jgi:hypothetical protein